MLPSSLQTRVDAVTDAETKQLISDIVAYFGGQSSTEDAQKLLAGAQVYRGLSLILPERRRVDVAISKKGIAVIVKDTVLVHSDWSVFDFATCLPVPDRPKPTWNVVVANRSGQDAANSLVFTLNDTAADKFLADAKPVSIRQSFLASLKPHVKEVVEEPILHVTAHQGSREGVLAFLNHYILFGYRKPLVILPLQQIRSISYTVVTRLTFNIVVSLVSGGEHEFSMISHDSYDAINDYVTDRDLENSSLAEERRAKKPRVAPSELATAEEEARQLPEGDDDLDDDSEEDAKFTDESDSEGEGESGDEDEDSAGSEAEESDS